MLEGELKHEDSMGNKFVLCENEIQTMTAGTGIFHSEKNNLENKAAKLLQIWVFPKFRNEEPSYGQIAFSPEERKNRWHLVVSPDQPNTALIKQDAYFSLASLDKNLELNYQLVNPSNGVYVFVIKGEVLANEISLDERDGMGFSETETIKINAVKNAEILVMEIPL
jgi:redox-sensitive bicupin YhaK (pirin superfamily)